MKSIKNDNFKPLYIELLNLMKCGNESFGIGVEDDIKSFGFTINVGKDYEVNLRVLERLVKASLFIVGGYRLYLSGDEAIIRAIKNIYSVVGQRSNEVKLIKSIYGKDLEIVECSHSDIPNRLYTTNKPRRSKGNVIGIDVGGTDYKLVCKVRGRTIFSGEFPWFPKINDDPRYHIDEIKNALIGAFNKMPYVDAIAISSAGIIVNNDVRVAALFNKIPEANRHLVNNFYKNIIKDFGVKYGVFNDGDVAAFTGARFLRKGRVLGIAMGTSEAGGYVDSRLRFNGFMSEISFMPLDLYEGADTDWVGDAGTSGRYLSQDAVIRLAMLSGISLPDVSLGEKLRYIQSLDYDMTDPIFSRIGEYLGYALPLYALFYDFKRVVLMGRVVDGRGGDVIVKSANSTLDALGYSRDFKVCVLNKSLRRLGQADAVTNLV